jgi:hypothetical protein
MTDAVITEYAGTRRADTITRFYQYGSGGVRVLDGRKVLVRLYRFDPSSDIMTEVDPVRPDRVLRRFVFDRMGMNEETFAFGTRPRTFRYEQGGRQIAVREGGEYGQVGKIFTFEDTGISETGWGRNGEIERVFVFERGNDTITERAGGWFGDVTRTIVAEGINTSLFFEPEAFLQFLVFTEWSEADRDAHVNEQVAKIRSGKSPYASKGGRSAPGASRPGAAVPRASRSRQDDSGIDFIPDGDAPARAPAESSSRRSDSISFAERLNRDTASGRSGSSGIPFQERFGGARREREPLAPGRSVEIPLAERFENARSTRGELSKGRSAEIPLQDRFESARGEHEPLSKGRSVEIPLEERFESARSTREKLSKGKSAEIPWDERRGGSR